MSILVMHKVTRRIEYEASIYLVKITVTLRLIIVKKRPKLMVRQYPVSPNSDEDPQQAQFAHQR